MEKVIAEVLVWLVSALTGGLIVMWCWDIAMPELFKLQEISYYNSLALYILTSTLFKSERVRVTNFEDKD